MPMKPKFSKEQIIDTALEYISINGIESFSARELAKALGSSSCPIFTCFKNMEEVVEEVKEKAKLKYKEYVEKAFDYTPAFKKAGMLMISFAKEEPKLFQFLFMKEDGKPVEFHDMIASLGRLKDECINVIMKDYDLTYDMAYHLFEHLWLYSYGLSVLCATSKCDLSTEIIVKMLGKSFLGMIMLMKSGAYDMETPTPVLKNEDNIKFLSSFMEGKYGKNNK